MRGEGALPNEWEVVSIGDIAAGIPRSIAIGPFGSSLKSEMYAPMGVPVVRGKNIGDSPYILDDDLVYVDEDTAKSLSGSIVQPGDLVFPHRGAIGAVALVRDREYLLSSSMMKLTCDTRRVDPKFVLYYFRGNGRDELLTRASTVGTPGIGQPLRSLRSIKIPLPSKAVQESIAEVLGALDDKIAANRKLADTAGALLAARFSALQLDEDYGDQVRLDTYFELNPKCAKPIADEPTYLDMQKLPTSEILISDWDKRLAKSGTRFMNGDTLLARITPCLENRKVGYVDFLDENEVALGSTEYIVFRARPGVPKELAFFLATSARFRATAMQHMVGTSGRQRLSASDVAGFTLRKIEDSTLADWGAGAAPLLKHLGSLRDENRTLASLRDALLPRLMSGELRVQDGERLVENLA